MYMNVLPAGMSAPACACLVPVQGRRGCQLPWNQSHRRCELPRGCLEWLSRRAAISLSPRLQFFLTEAHKSQAENLTSRELILKVEDATRASWYCPLKRFRVLQAGQQLSPGITHVAGPRTRLWELLVSKSYLVTVVTYQLLCLLRLRTPPFLLSPVGSTALHFRVSCTWHQYCGTQLCTLYQGPWGKMWLVPTADSRLLSYSWSWSAMRFRTFE